MSSPPKLQPLPPARATSSSAASIQDEVQLRPGLGPLATHRAIGDTKRGGDLGFLHSGEEAALHDLTLPLVQIGQRVVERDQLFGVEAAALAMIRERHLLPRVL